MNSPKPEPKDAGAGSGGRKRRRRGVPGVRLPAMVGGGLWTLSAKLVAQIAQLAVFVIAARVLSPAEFGFFAFGAAIAVFLIVISEGGWADFVMKTGDGPDRIGQVATLSLLSGLLLTGVGLSISAALAFGFGRAWEGSLLALFSCCVLPAALNTTYDGSLVYHGRLRAQATIRIAAETAGLIAAIGGLLAGWNVFALVAGRLAMQLLLLCGSVLAVGRLSRPHLERRFAGEVLEFSRHVVSVRLIVFLRSYSGTLALGSFLGLAEAGYYRAAERIVASFSELVGEPARMLGWLVFRRAAERGAVRKAGNSFMPLLLAVSAPVYLGLALVSPGVVDVVLGEAWKPTALLVAVLAVKQLLLIPSYVSQPLLAIGGEIRRLPPISLLNGLVAVSLIVVLAPFGPLVVAFGQCLAAVITLGITIRLQGRYGGMDWRRIAANSAVVVVAVMAMISAVLLVDYLTAASRLGVTWVLALQVLAGAAAYLALLRMRTIPAVSWRHQGTLEG